MVLIPLFPGFLGHTFLQLRPSFLRTTHPGATSSHPPAGKRLGASSGYGRGSEFALENDLFPIMSSSWTGVCFVLMFLKRIQESLAIRQGA